MRIEEVEIRLIVPDVHRRRPINETVVKELAESIKREGLLHPITVRLDGNRLRLVAGAHRLEAVAMILGLDTISAIICDLSDDEAEVVELEENLVRNDLTKAQRDENICRLAELLKLGQNVPVSDKGGRGRIGISAVLSQRLGLQKKTVQRALRGGKQYVPRNTPEPKPRTEAQDTAAAPSAKSLMEAAFVLIHDCWGDLPDAFRADLKLTIAELPGGQIAEGQMLLPPRKIKELADAVTDSIFREGVARMVENSERSINRKMCEGAPWGTA